MFFDTMFSLLVLCRVLIIAGVQTLTIDSQLGTSREDCFERISIGEQLPSTAIYRNVSELTSRECEHICRQDNQCQVYDYGVGAKGNATCNLSMLDEKEVREKNLLLRHPDYDVYVRRVLCEQTPPKPMQVLQDDPGPPGPQHRPVFRPDPEDRPLNQDYLISSDIPYHKPQNPYRPDGPSNTGPDYDFPPSYGQHKPQIIPYKPSRPNDKFKPRPQKPMDQNDQLHFQGYGLHRPDLLNDYHAYKPDSPNYLNRPNRRPQDDYNRPDGPIGPPDRPIRPNRPYKPSYDYNNQYASNYGQNNQYASNYGQNNPNDVYVEIYDPPRPYIPIKDRPHQDYGPGYLGYGTYGTYSSQNSYTGTITEIGYGQNDRPIYNRPQNDRPQKPVYGEIDDNQGYQRPEKPQTDFSSNYGSNQDYNRPVSDYGGYGYQKPSYNKPSYQNDDNYNDQGLTGYGNKPSDGYRPQKPNRPYGVTQDGYGSQGSYGSGQTGYGGGQNSYGSSQGSYSGYDSYNQGGYGSFGSSQYGSPYGQNYGSSYGFQNDYDYNRPGYGNDQYNKPYQKPKPEYDYQKPQKPGYGDQKPGYGDQIPGYGDQNPGYGDQKPGYGDLNPSYDNKPGYGVTKPTYDDKPTYGNQKPDYTGQTTGYGGQKPGYNDQTTGYGGQKPGYSDQTTGYGGQNPDYSDQTTGYGGQKPGYSDQTTGYGNQKPGYNDQNTGYGDETGYNANKPAYSDLTPSYGNQKPIDKPGSNQNPQKPLSRPQKPAYSSGYDSYNNQKPGANYSDPNRPDVRPVYEYDLDKPGNVPSYIVRPGGDIVTSHPVVIGDYGKHPAYKEPSRISYKACFRRVLAGRRALRGFVRKVYNCDTLDDCKKECATEKRFHCESFNYRQNPSYQGQGLCELMTKPIESFNVQRDFIEDKNYDFYEIDRNSLEPNCAETLRGPGKLHSGFLSSKPPRDGGGGGRRGAGGGWKERNWSGDGSYYDQKNKQTSGAPDRNQKRKFEDEYIPYQIGVMPRSNDQDKWGAYGGLYGGNQEYYKDRNDYHKSVTHWGLSTIEPPSTKPYLSDFDYNTLGRHFEHSIRSTASDFDYTGPTFSKPPPTEFDAPRTTYAKTTSTQDDLAKEFYISGKTRYGYGPWKRGWGNSSGLNALDPGQLKGLEDINRNDVEEKECFSRRRPGMSLSSGAVRRSLLVRNVVECEAACFSELEFKCVSYSYRYSTSHTSDNCYLSERPYRGLELSADSGSDVYAMSQQCDSLRPYVESECFWHVRSDRAVSGTAVKAKLVAPGLGACEAECIRASGFFCRGFSFRFESPTVDDDDINNCVLTSLPSTMLEGNSRLATGHELYSRGNYGRGCEPATYEAVGNGECYLQYDKAAKLTPNAAHATLQTNSQQECANACTAAPFKCLSFSYSNHAAPSTANCLLSEIRLFDLQKDTDYVHSADDWLFAFDVFNTRCFRGRNNEIASDLPHPIHSSSEEETFPGTAPSSSTEFSDTPEPSGSPSGPSDPPTHFTTGPDKPHSGETTRLTESTQQYSTRPYPGKDDHSPELPRPIQNYRPRPNNPQIEPSYGPPDTPPGFRPPQSEVERPFRPERPGYKPWESETDLKPGLQPAYGPPASSYPGPNYPNRHGYQPGLKPAFQERPDYGPGFNSASVDMYGFGPELKPELEDGPGYGPIIKPEFGSRPGYGPGIKLEFGNRPDYGPGIKPEFGNRPGYGPGIKPEFGNRPGYGPGIKPEFGNRPGYGPGVKPEFGDRPGYLPEGPRPQKPVYHGDREDPGQESWRQYTVSGFPCRTGTVCAQNQVSGHWACEPEGGEIGSWDYCCAPTHRCGYSEGFQKPWCYVGSKEDQWRPCSDKYYPYHQHNGPHPSQSQGSPGKRENQKPYRPWRESYKPPIPSYIPHWDKRPGPYLSETDRIYWEKLYDNGPKAYYDRFENPLPGYSRVETNDKVHIKYRHHPPTKTNPALEWTPVSYERDPQIPGLGAPRYWPVAYLHKSSPPNMTYFRYNETYTTTTERYHPQTDIAEARNIDVPPELPRDLSETTKVPDSETERTNIKPSIFDKTHRDDKKINSTSTENTIVITTPKHIPTSTKEIITSTPKEQITTTKEIVKEIIKDNASKQGIDDKLADLEKSLEVLNIDDMKKEDSDIEKTLEAEERQIEALGRLIAARRGTKILLDKRSQKVLEDTNININKEASEFDFGNKFPTENPKQHDKSERRGTVKRISKAEIEKDRNTDKSLEVSETTFVRPPRVLSTTENIRQTVINGKIFYDATIKEQKESSTTINPVRQPKNLRRTEIPSPSRTIREKIESNPTNKPTKKPTTLGQETIYPTDLTESISIKNLRRAKNYRRLAIFKTNGTISEPKQFTDKTTGTGFPSTRNPSSRWITIPNPTVKVLTELYTDGKLRSSKVTDNLKERTQSPSTKEPKKPTLKTTFTPSIPTPYLTTVNQNDWTPKDSIKNLISTTKSETPTPDPSNKNLVNLNPNPFNLNLNRNPHLNPNPFNLIHKPFNLGPYNPNPHDPKLPTHKPPSNPVNSNSSNSNSPTTLVINHNNARKKKVRARNVNPVRRVKRVYKKRYNPDEVRRRLLDKEKSYVQ